jgi:hypothetical protein
MAPDRRQPHHLLGQALAAFMPAFMPPIGGDLEGGRNDDHAYSNAF